METHLQKGIILIYTLVFLSLPIWYKIAKRNVINLKTGSISFAHTRSCFLVIKIYHRLKYTLIIRNLNFEQENTAYLRVARLITYPLYCVQNDYMYNQRWVVRHLCHILCGESHKDLFVEMTIAYLVLAPKNKNYII